MLKENTSHGPGDVTDGVSIETDVNLVLRCAERERHLCVCSPVHTSIRSELAT